MARKGLSQILFLIIAASVLMMAALTLIFAFNQGIGGSTEDVGNSACGNAIETQCTVAGNPANVPIPANCPSDLSGITGHTVVENDEGNDAVSC